MRIEASLALFATTLASESAENTNSAPHHGSTDDQATHMDGHHFHDTHLTEDDIMGVSAEQANDRSMKNDQKKFSEWTTEQRVALKDLPVDPLSEKRNSAEHESHSSRSLQATGDGYTNICNPFLGTCTCNAGDYWQLGWCQSCEPGCDDCSSMRACVSCVNNLVLDANNECKCTAGIYDASSENCESSCAAGTYFNYSTQTCDACSTNCNDCKDANTCYSCTLPMILNNNAGYWSKSSNECVCI